MFIQLKAVIRSEDRPQMPGGVTVRHLGDSASGHIPSPVAGSPWQIFDDWVGIGRR
jgi:hypothetical protein